MPGFVSWVLGIVFGVSGFVSWVSGIVFWVLGLTEDSAPPNAGQTASFDVGNTSY